MPYGVYDIATNSGWVSVGSITTPPALPLTPSGAGGKAWTGSLFEGAPPADHRRLWRQQWRAGALMETRFAGLAHETGLTITVRHLPPGTSKWNKIGCRLFSFITQNWRDKPPVSYQAIVQLNAVTTTRLGLSVRREIDTARITVSHRNMASINISPHPFHAAWNHTIRPNSE